MSATRAKCVVTVVLEVESAATWGPHCAISQAHSQATEGAMGIVSRLLEEYRPSIVIKSVSSGRVVIEEVPES